MPGRRGGRPKRIGAKIGTATHLADHRDTTWTRTTVNRYDRTDTVTIAETRMSCATAPTYPTTVRVILLRELGHAPQPATTSPCSPPTCTSPADTMVTKAASGHERPTTTPRSRGSVWLRGGT